MISIAICEDNSVHTQRLHNMVEPLLNVPYTITAFSSGQKFCHSLEEGENSYDLVFMDIELEADSMTGIQLAQKINSISPHTQIIYTSQYLEYASPVYETKHVYFVHKAQMDQYLEKALDSALKNLEIIRGQYLYFKKRKRQFRIPQSDILYMERILRNTDIYTREEKHSTSDSLKTLMEQLSPSFVLCHRSFVVNLKAVSSFSREKITLFNGQTIPVGRTHYSQIQKSFAKVMLSD